MNYIKLYMLLATVVILLSNCSGGGEGTFDTGIANIVVSDCESYTDISANDLLVKDDENTIVKILHNADGSRRVCVVSGSAHIVREAN